MQCNTTLFFTFIFFFLINIIGYSQPLYQVHWTSVDDPTFSGSGGGALSQALDSTCSSLQFSVADINSPLAAFSPLIINPQQINGGDLIDLSGNMSFYVRVRSRETVRLGLLLRSGDGGNDFRTDRLEEIVQGDTTSWTEIAFSFDTSQLGGFDSTDLRDVWFYLDRGDENFAGNDLVFDYFSIGAAPDSSTFSTCLTDTTSEPVINPINYALHFDSSNDPTFSGSGGNALTQGLDSACSWIKLSVTEPILDPLPSFSPIIVNPKDSNGDDITDLSGSMSFHFRVRSRDSVRLGFLLRSGDGSGAFRTDRIEEIVPGDTTAWTELTFTFDPSQLGGFDSTDLRDIWFYLDVGDENFSGDAFWVDYFAFGEKPDPSTHSSCSLLPPFEFPWVLHWADTFDQITSGSGAEFITQIVDTTCSQIGLSITEPILFPHPAFRPIRLDPLDQFGNDLKDISGQLRLFARVRSLEEVEFSAILRGGGGAQEERSKLLAQIIPAGLEQWTEVVFDFSGANREGFDPTDLRDIFLYLNRDEANFPGNEFYIDYISLGSPPDTTENSSCVATVGISPFQLAESIRVYPNPLQRGETLQVEFDTQPGTVLRFRLLSLTGQVIQQSEQISQGSQYELNWEHLALPQGLYLLKIESELGFSIHKINVH